MQRLALVLGGEITSTFDTPENVRLGECKSIEEVMIGEDNLLKFSGVKLGEACTVVLRGATQQILDEADRFGKEMETTNRMDKQWNPAITDFKGLTVFFRLCRILVLPF